MSLRIALFCHSLVSDWNHGNAHFLRGVVSELLAQGHSVRVFEPDDGWSRSNLVAEHGTRAIEAFHRAFPALSSETYRLDPLQIEPLLDGIDLAIVHEWNTPALVKIAGEQRRHNPALRLLFHDTHHRALTAEHELARFDLSEYDGVLAYGASLRDAYVRRGWGKHVYVWHEAADIRTFYPHDAEQKRGDIVWIGNWGDEERTQELREYFINPVRQCSWKAQVYGVRYPETGIRELQSASISYGGWLPNFDVPRVFAQYRATVHVPRRPYTQELPGIPTIRPFEALACGVPLVSAPWNDAEGLFRVGMDFLMAKNGQEMEACLHAVLNDRALASSLATNGLETIRSRHTCAHRVQELIGIYNGMKPAKLGGAANSAAELVR